MECYLRFYVRKEWGQTAQQRQKWFELKRILENSESPLNNIMIDWEGQCLLESNRNLPLLNGLEGGLGGDKQLRPRFFDIDPLHTDDDIIINVYNTEHARFTEDELQDLLDGFVRMARNYVGTSFINGYMVTLSDRVDE